MKRIAIVIMVASFAGAAAADGFNTSWTEGWRVTAGGAMNGNMRTKMGIRQDGAWRRGIPASAPLPSGTSRAEAQAAGDAYDSISGRVSLPGGGFIDPASSRVEPGTWNWYIPAGALGDGGVTTIVDSYSEFESHESFSRVSGKDDDYAAGFSVGFERELWRKGGFGADLGFGLSYFRNSGFFKAGGAAYTRTQSGSSGDYVTDIAFNPDVIGDPWAQNPDGSYGAGTYDGPGPVLDLGGGDLTVSHRWANISSSSRSSSYYLHAEGDYEDIEMTFAVKPFWDVTDWLRLRGTLGVAVSRTHFTFDVDGQGYSSRQRFDDWSVYGVGGLGGMLRWENFCLGVDFIARFLDDDIEIRGRDVRGSVERAPWMLTVYAGYEF